MSGKRLLFSVTKDDFIMQTFACGGKGGSGKDTGNSGVRLIHKDSGAVGEGREERHQLANKKRAFERLVKTKEFMGWHKLECARRMGKPREETTEEILARVDQIIADGLRDGSIVVENTEDGI